MKFKEIGQLLKTKEWKSAIAQFFLIIVSSLGLMYLTTLIK